MQINVRGEMSMADLRQALFEKLGELEESYAIAFSRGATLYVNPTDGSGETVQARGRDGRKVEKISSGGPYRTAADEFSI